MSDDDDYEFKAEQAKAEWYEDEKDEHDRAGILAAMSAEAADDDAYRSVNGFIQVPKHQASLRDRIAAAMQARDEAKTAGIPDPLMLEHATYEELADAVIAELQPLLEAEYNRGYDEGIDWLHDESRWIKGESDDE